MISTSELLEARPVAKDPWRTVWAMYLRRHLTRRSVIVVVALANIPTIVAAVLLYLIGQGKQVGPLSGVLPGIELKLARPFVDNFLTATAILAGIVGPSSIAGGRRVGAIVFHMLRPMRRRDFVLGQWLAVSTTLCGTSLVPLVLLFLFARLVIPSQLLGALPWHDLLRVAGVGAGIAGLVGLLVVALSMHAGSTRGGVLLWLLTYFGSKFVADVLVAVRLRGPVRCLAVPDILRQGATYGLEGVPRIDGCGAWWVAGLGVLVAGSLVLLRRGGYVESR